MKRVGVCGGGGLHHVVPDSGVAHGALQSHPVIGPVSHTVRPHPGSGSREQHPDMTAVPWIFSPPCICAPR